MTTKKRAAYDQYGAAGANGGFGGAGGFGGSMGQEASVVLKISSQVSSAEAVLHAIQMLLVRGMTSNTV